MNSYHVVDLSEKVPVQFMYRQNVYNGFIQYDQGNLKISFEDNDMKGLAFNVTNQDCEIVCENMVQLISFIELPPESLPHILHTFFSEWQGKIPLENKDEESRYTKRSNANGFVEFRCYTSNDKEYYTIEIK